MWMRVLVIPPKRNETKPNETKRNETVCICIIHAIEPSAVMTGHGHGALDLNLAEDAGEDRGQEQERQGGDRSQATRKIIISQVIIGFAIQMRKGNADTERGLKSTRVGFLFRLFSLLLLLAFPFCENFCGRSEQQ